MFIFTQEFKKLRIKYYRSNMKRYLILIILLFSLVHNLKSQNEDLTTSRFELTLMPSSIVDFSPRIRMGLEYYSSARLGYSLDFAYGNSGLIELLNRDWGKEYQLFEFRAEMKYFFVLKKSITFYVGPEFFNISTKDVLEYSWYRKSNAPSNELDIITRYDRADFYRQKLGVHILTGLKLIAFHRIDFDFYAGIGAAYRDIKYSHVVNPRNEEYHAYQDFWPDRRANEGQQLILHFAAGIKMGIILWEN
jgi:hypothetical protein